MADEICPCGSARGYDLCCGRLHAGISVAQSPEELMRSRYAAFVRRDAPYLLNTHHASTRSPQLAAGLQETFRTAHWIGLRVVGSGLEPAREDRGWVEFVAFQGAPEYGQIHERSRFVREDGNWQYVDGRHLPELALDRNGPCVCGSGRKWKKCHGGASGA
ncbi:MAG: SEC-C domain-containing protein [Fibrobacterota bacterium]|nr:SEC-C domain-containing protein [Fibrobacterota bacterium]QQS04485.1 MAG: SEC-C domain-containing protein [Fibrobacterota bacterium]